MDEAVRVIQILVETQITDAGGIGEIERLQPFKQQAATVSRAKDNAAEKVQELQGQMRTIESALEEKRKMVINNEFIDCYNDIHISGYRGQKIQI